MDAAVIFSVFSSSQGQLLISKWKDSLIKVPSATHGMDQLSIGLVEGEKTFIRKILTAIDMHDTNPTNEK